MHITRRKFCKATVSSVAIIGANSWPFESRGASASYPKIYPPEFQSLEAYTKGKVRAGDTIHQDNVHLVANLLDPVRLNQIRHQGRRLEVSATTNHLDHLAPPIYVEATLRNLGRARFDDKGNVVADDGGVWVGGNPFPDPKSATEVFAAHTLSWSRHESNFYAIKEYDLDPSGDIQYQYSAGWAEYSAVERADYKSGRAIPRELEGKLRLQSVFFAAPSEVQGTAYLNIWPYDQSKLPDLYGYIPAFKRVRRFPTNQRFEPLIPGSELYLSDAWAAGDPFLSWGNYRIVSRGPYLAAVSRGWNSGHPNWEHMTHGGTRGKTFWDMCVELVPEVIVVEAFPLAFPRAPVGRKLVWFDARTLIPLAMLSFDRRGQMFRFFDVSYSRYEDGAMRVSDGQYAYWSWCAIHAYNLQTNRMTRIEQVRELPGGHHMRVNDPSIYDRYLSLQAIQRLGG